MPVTAARTVDVRPVEEPVTDEFGGDVIDRSHKGFWPVDGARDAAGYLAAGHHLFDGSFTWPVLVLRDSALRHNIDTLAGFAAERGLLLAPHGKTTMAPALWQRQLAAGAWGITVATASQAAVARAAGVAQVVLANEVLDPAATAWIATQLAADSRVRLPFWVDSQAGVDAAVEGVRRAAAGRPVDAFLPGGLEVFVDVGYPGGRTGCRTDDDAFAVAAAVAATPGLALGGVAGYEGGLGDAAAAGAYLRRLAQVANALHERGLLAADAIVTAGGSAYFDVLADTWADCWRPGFTPRVVLRSGAYITHDDGVYERKTPFNRIAGSLRPAIEVWAQVISAGDPGRAILGLGKRDAPYDDGLPVPHTLRRAGVSSPLTGCAVRKLDDQHAYLDGAAGLRPGDLVGLGISHPCTAFDKWRLVPVVDDDHRVIELVRTYF
jgi:D-serine deaminase-like pyridoxal phosphate-dependent protein